MKVEADSHERYFIEKEDLIKWKELINEGEKKSAKKRWETSIVMRKTIY
jgi:hypothetical protein